MVCASIRYGEKSLEEEFFSFSVSSTSASKSLESAHLDSDNSDVKFGSVSSPSEGAYARVNGDDHTAGDVFRAEKADATICCEDREEEIDGTRVDSETAAAADSYTDGATAKPLEPGPYRTAETSPESREEYCNNIINDIRENDFGVGLTKVKQHKHSNKNLGRALQKLSEELYSKNIHFVMELVQNADDNSYAPKESPALRFVIRPGLIVVQNNEIGFSERNVRSICAVGDSTKKKSGDQGEESEECDDS